MQLKLFNSEVMIKYTKLKNLCYSSLCWTLPFAWKVSVIKSSELVILGGVHRMNKFLMAGIVAAMAAATSVATASPLVTANVPLDSRYYRYIDKLEGMGYIKDMPTGTRPYSRLDMAKWIMEAQHKAQTKPMPGYLKTYYEEMRADLAEEIAYLQGANTDYGSNIKLRAVEARLAYGDMRQDSYRYRKGINASWQPLNRNNNGYRYGDGINIIGAAEIFGSLNKDLALSLTPRFSYDKDQH